MNAARRSSWQKLRAKLGASGELGGLSSSSSSSQASSCTSSPRRSPRYSPRSSRRRRSSSGSSWSSSSGPPPIQWAPDQLIVLQRFILFVEQRNLVQAWTSWKFYLKGHRIWAIEKEKRELADEMMRLAKLHPPGKRPREVRDQFCKWALKAGPEVFKKLSNIAMDKCMQYVELRSYNELEVMFLQGQQGSHYYIIVHGQVKIFVEDNKEFEQVKCASFVDPAKGPEWANSTIAQGDTSWLGREVWRYGKRCGFGELSLFEGDGVRNASAATGKPTDCMLIPKWIYLQTLMFYHREAWIAKRKITFLQTLPLFSTWSKRRVVDTSFTLTRNKYVRGGIVLDQNRPAEDLIFIVRGEVRLLRMLDDQDVSVLKKAGRNAQPPSVAQSRLAAQAASVAKLQAEKAKVELEASGTLGRLSGQATQRRRRNQAGSSPSRRRSARKGGAGSGAGGPDTPALPSVVWREQDAVDPKVAAKNRVKRDVRCRVAVAASAIDMGVSEAGLGVTEASVASVASSSSSSFSATGDVGEQFVGEGLASGGSSDFLAGELISPLDRPDARQRRNPVMSLSILGPKSILGLQAPLLMRTKHDLAELYANKRREDDPRVIEQKRALSRQVELLKSPWVVVASSDVEAFVLSGKALSSFIARSKGTNMFQELATTFEQRILQYKRRFRQAAATGTFRRMLPTERKSGPFSPLQKTGVGCRGVGDVNGGNSKQMVSEDSPLSVLASAGSPLSLSSPSRSHSLPRLVHPSRIKSKPGGASSAQQQQQLRRRRQASEQHISQIAVGGFGSQNSGYAGAPEKDEDMEQMKSRTQERRRLQRKPATSAIASKKRGAFSFGADQQNRRSQALDLALDKCLEQHLREEREKILSGGARRRKGRDGT